jgi:hypothetical protein
MPFECLICLSYEEIPNNPFVCFFSDKCSCNVFAHKNCISDWKNMENNKNKCPNCRTLGKILELDVNNNQSQIYINLPVSELPVERYEVQPSNDHVIINPLNNIDLPINNNSSRIVVENRTTINYNRIFEIIGNLVYGLLILIVYIFYGIYLLIRFILIGLNRLFIMIKNQPNLNKKIVPVLFILGSIILFIYLLVNFANENSEHQENKPIDNDDNSNNDE